LQPTVARTCWSRWPRSSKVLLPGEIAGHLPGR